VAGQDPVGTPAINAGKAAPPLGSQDESAPASNAVGAHLRHASDDATSGNRLAAAIKCQQCHGAALPVDVSHVDGQVVLGWQLAAQGTTPTPAAGRYPRSATSPTPVTCANYCHGATLVGGTFKTPSWTGAGTVGCGTCHGVPPDYAAAMSGGRGHHPPNASCGSCHAGSTAAAPARATHVNGTVDVVALACNSCHGGAANNAPPTDTTGGAVAARVGAHQAHVAGKTYTDGLGGNASCTECHGALPTSTGHANGVVDLAWGTIASTGSTPTPAAGAIAPASAVTCTNSCHNVKTASGGGTGGSLASVTWTGSITACNSCHAIPSSGGHHTSVGEHRAAACNKCHPAAYSSTTVDPTLHVNGIRNVTATGWNAANRSCGNNGTGCHGTSTKGPW
jgi:predicted CxxxxCH...CXXCH cytochrome family protein